MQLKHYFGDSNYPTKEENSKYDSGIIYAYDFDTSYVHDLAYMGKCIASSKSHDIRYIHNIKIRSRKYKGSCKIIS